MKKMNRKGFTIVELVIVIAVIAILAGVLIPTFSNMIDKANDSAVLQEARSMYTNYMAAVDYAAGEAASKNALVKVVKGDDTYYVKVMSGSMDDTIYDTQPTITAGGALIESDSSAESGIKWETITCDTIGEDHDPVHGFCSKCGVAVPAQGGENNEQQGTGESDPT